MNRKQYAPVIGLEVHVELKTKSKMFCGCSADYFGQKPNTHTCPVCLGLPGALPVPNKKAIDWCVIIGLALNCKIPLLSKFDRKNYFYPDLPKGYQISQYDQPFATDGHIEIADGKKIRIRRVHMEEDTGKLVHQTLNGENVTLIDFNRSGVPLVEIVTEPDFETASEVVEYLKKLQQIVRYLGVSDADMEKGEMRLEPNISLRENTTNTINKQMLPIYKVEVKNINSFHFVEKAINYEIKRQVQILSTEKNPIQETRGWNEKYNRTDSQRSKESAHDYRYFPEPDIPPLRFTQIQISQLADQMPELPDRKIRRFKEEYGLSDYNSKIISRDKKMADFFEETVKIGKNHQITPKQIANFIINKKIDLNNVLPLALINLIKQSSQKVIIDEQILEENIERILIKNQRAVNDYKKGKEQAIMFLVGQVLRVVEKIDPKYVKEKLKKMLQ